MIDREQALRSAVVAEALSWLGTPYHSHARVKGAGVDCVHLLAAVYEAVGLLPPTDPGWYAPQWHMHRSEERYLHGLEARMARTVAPLPGDVGLWRFGRTYSHAGIVADDGCVVHAFVARNGAGSVVRSRLTEAPLARRPVLFFNMSTLETIDGR